MRYYIMKTGMEMFDACRAYGLALVLDTLAKLKDIDQRLYIEDVGPYYLVDGPQIDEIPSDLEKNTNWISLFDERTSWNYIFLTTLSQNQKDKKREEYQKEITNKISDILRNYGRLGYVPKIVAESSAGRNEKSAGYDTIYMSIEVRAGKGLRSFVRDKYGEGEQLLAPKADLSLAYLGGAHFMHWIWGDAAVGILPAPERIILSSHFEIQKLLLENRINKLSIITILANYAVNLAEEIRKKKADCTSYAQSYSKLIYNALVKTGAQWKPASAGLFPLGFFWQMIDDDNRNSEEIFRVWKNLFEKGNQKGREDLAFSLSEFLTYPNLTSLENHMNVHLRYLLNKEVFIRTYSKENMQLVMKYV